MDFQKLENNYLCDGLYLSIDYQIINFARRSEEAVFIKYCDERTTQWN